jgi:hypothetical protein
MDKAEKRLLYHLRSALGARDSRNRVSRLSAHLLDFPAHEAHRKELRKRQTELKKRLLYDPSSTLSHVRKWGPSTRNILRSMEYAVLEEPDPIEDAAKEAAIAICRNPSAISEISLDLMAQSEGSNLIFLRRRRNGKVVSGKGQRFIPTTHLRALFEVQRRGIVNNESFQLFRG